MFSPHQAALSSSTSRCLAWKEWTMKTMFSPADILKKGITKACEDAAEERHHANSCVYSVWVIPWPATRVHWITNIQKTSLPGHANFERRIFIYIYDKLSFKLADVLKFMNLKIQVHDQLRFIATMDSLSLGNIFRGYLYLGCSPQRITLKLV